MAARKKAEPKTETVEKVDAPSESEQVEAVEVEAQADSKKAEAAAESESTVTHEDGGLAALQAKFDDASRKGYFGPDKEI